MICAEPDIEGVTFLGGEPFEQAKALAKLAEKIRKRGLSVLTFTGNTYEELQTRNDSHVNKLIENTDLLVDGAFEKDKFTTERPWVGSENQRYLFLTDRYCEKDITISKNKIEIRVDKKGLVFVNGMGDFNKIKNDIICV